MSPATALSSLLLLASLTGPSAGVVPSAKVSPSSAAGSLQVVAVHGEVLARGQQIRAGATLAAGTNLHTGKDGHVRIHLTEGSSLTLQASGQLSIVRHRAQASGKGSDTSLRLEHGRIEANVRALRQGDSRLEIRTAAAIATTRGALFRMTADPVQRSATVEAVDGSVRITDPEGSGGVAVSGGFGTRAVAGSAPIKPVPLLAGPHLWTGIQLVERKRAEIPISPLAGAVTYRVIITPSADLARHLVEEVVPAPRVRIATLADGDYFVRVRAIDGIGLEGGEAIARIRLRVLADPPELVRPSDRDRLYGNSVELGWLPDPTAIGYVAQLDADSAFRSRQREWNDLREPTVSVAGLRPGTYYWRVASVFKDGSQSRNSPVRTFRLDVAPTAPAAPSVEHGRMRFSWPGSPGQSFVLQLAADPRFEFIIEERRTDQPGADLPRPPQGTFFARLRTTEANGSVSPYSEAIRIEIPAIGVNAPGGSCLVQGERGVCAVYAPPATPSR